MINQVISDVTRIFEVAGVLIIALGASVAIVRGVVTWRRRHDIGVYLQLRRDLGRSILLGLGIDRPWPWQQSRYGQAAGDAHD